MESVQTGTVRVKIEVEERSLEDVEPSWVIEQVNRHRRANQPVFVQVNIRTDGVTMTLASPECGPSLGGGGGRGPNRREQEVFELWHQMGLDQHDFNGGHVNAFLQRLRHLL